MNVAIERSDLGPPADTRWGRPLTLALVAHGLLVAALTWGVRWQTETAVPAVEAELWSRLPQEAAPRAVEPPAPPPPPVPTPAPPPPGPTQAEIALQQAKKKAEEQKRLQALREVEARKKAAEDKRKLEEKKLAEDKARREREKAQAEAKKREEAKRLAEEKRRDAQIAAERQKNLERMLGQAGATGGATARGTEQRASGPSASYYGKVAARIKQNIVYSGNTDGDPKADVDVRLLPDGTIASSKLVKSSGNPAWDEAVMRAIERTGRLPLDENGRAPSTIPLTLKPLN